MTAGELKENLASRMDTLRSRKVRSALTILGIVIGVTSVICVAAIIDGLNALILYAHQQLRVAIVLHQPHSAGLQRHRPAPAEDPDAQISGDLRRAVPEGERAAASTSRPRSRSASTSATARRTR